MLESSSAQTRPNPCSIGTWAAWLLACVCLWATGCAPEIHRAGEGDVQPISPSTFEPLVGCYKPLGELRNCETCAPQGFFPFPEGVDGSLGTATPIEDASEETIDSTRQRSAFPAARTVCLRRANDHTIVATEYSGQEPVARRAFTGRVRDDGRFILDTYTQPKFTNVVVVWTLTRGRAAFSVLPSGDLKRVEVRSSGIFLAFFPFFGTNFGYSEQFYRVPSPAE
jgi:hypothetical protein